MIFCNDATLSQRSNESRLSQSDSGVSGTPSGIATTSLATIPRERCALMYAVTLSGRVIPRFGSPLSSPTRTCGNVRFCAAVGRHTGHPTGSIRAPRRMMTGTLFDRRVHGNHRGARSRRPLSRCFDGKSIASLVSGLRLVLVGRYIELLQLAVRRLLQDV